jgi:hypothetical protein
MLNPILFAALFILFKQTTALVKVVELKSSCNQTTPFTYGLLEGYCAGNTGDTPQSFFIDCSGTGTLKKFATRDCTGEFQSASLATCIDTAFGERITAGPCIDFTERFLMVESCGGQTISGGGAYLYSLDTCIQDSIKIVEKDENHVTIIGCASSGKNREDQDFQLNQCTSGAILTIVQNDGTTRSPTPPTAAPSRSPTRSDEPPLQYCVSDDSNSNR